MLLIIKYKTQMFTLIFQLSAFFLVAQSFTVDFPQVVDTSTGTGQDILFVGTITNNLCCDLLEIEMSVTPLQELPYNWEMDICTPSGCGGLEQIFTLEAAQTDSISVNFFTGIHNMGDAKVSVKFLMTNDTTEQYEIDLMVSYVPDIISSVETVKNKDILFQNFPNPFLNKTTIRYELLNPGGILLVTDPLGREMKKYILSNQSGKIVIERELEQGVYFYSLYQKGVHIATRKLYVLPK